MKQVGNSCIACGTRLGSSFLCPLCQDILFNVTFLLQVPYFTHYMITIVNNCLQFVELAQLMKQHYWRPGLHDNEAGTKFEALLNTFQVNRNSKYK